MPDVFANDMVLQRNKPIPIFGTANANEEITVAFNKRTKKTKSDSNGKWKVVFNPLPAGGPYNLVVKSRDKKIQFTNILMGDVWFCAGQSNMLFRLNQSYEGKQAIENSTNKNIRLFQLNAIEETNDVAWDSVILYKVNKLEYFAGNWTNAISKLLPLFLQSPIFLDKKFRTKKMFRLV